MQSLQSSTREFHIKAGEWHDALWHQYMNTIDSLRAQSAESQTIPGLGPIFKSHPSIETFDGNVNILQWMCHGYGIIDDTFLTDNAKVTAGLRFAKLTKILKEKEFWKEARTYLGRI